MPLPVSASTIDPDTPRAAKVVSVVTCWCLSGIGGAQVRGATARWLSTKWRDCRWAKSIAARQTPTGGTCHLNSVAQRRLGAGTNWDEERSTTLSASTLVRQHCC